MNYKKVILSLLILLLLSSCATLPATAVLNNETSTIAPQPTTIPEKYHWDLTAIFPDDAAWEKGFLELEEVYIPKFKTYEGKLAKAETLLEFFKMQNDASKLIERLITYARMHRDTQMKDSGYSEKVARISSLSSDLSKANAFCNPELLALPQGTLEGYLKNPLLSDYQLGIDLLIKQKAHTLSGGEEKILAMAGEIGNAPETIAEKIREADIQFPTIKDTNGNEISVSESNYVKMMTDPDRDFRKSGYDAFLKTYDGMKYSLAAALDAQVRKDIFFSQARKYNSALESSLASNNIPVSVYDNLEKATDKELTALHRYYTLRKNVLKIDKVHGYDGYISLIDKLERNIPYDETQKIMLTALAPLGKEYLTDMQAGFDNRWIDVFPMDDKLSGAYAWANYETHPYMLLNYQPNVSGLLETSHEMGHALNFFYTNKTQPYSKSNIPIFTAEVASTTNELLVLHYLLNNAASDDEKLFYLDQIAGYIHGTFYAQVLYAEFEREIHERVENGEALSVENLGESWKKLVEKFNGPDYQFDDVAKVGWARIPHLYYNFYVYQYATSLSASNQFASDILENKPGAVDNYLSFLAAGSSDYPVEVLRKAGVDMTSATPVEKLIQEFNSVLDQMESILKNKEKFNG